MDNLNSLKPDQEKRNTYYESAMRWIEDTYLNWFGENRTSYGVKDTLRQGEVTGNKDIDGTQRAVSDTIGNQFAEGGIGEGVGKIADKGLLSR